jgi:hypothetical protein
VVEIGANSGKVLSENPHSVIQSSSKITDRLRVFGYLFLPPAVSDGPEEGD